MRNPKYYLKEILKEVLPKYCKGKVVDVGAGHAKYGWLIEPLCDSYTTVDNMSSDYQFRETEFRPDVVSDVSHMPFKNNEFDTAICTEVLEHVENPFQLFLEISRILKPDGYAIISSGWAAAYHKEPKDYWRFSLDAYKVLCERSNLEFIEARRKGGLLILLLYFVNRNIELNIKGHAIFKKLWSKISKVLGFFIEKLDQFIKTEDTLGHLIVARKNN